MTSMTVHAPSPPEQVSATARRRVRALSAALLVAGLVAAPTASAASRDGATASASKPASASASRDGGDAGTTGTALEFQSMTPVTEPLTGTANPIRGIPGGGLPWEIDAAKGELQTSGRLELKVDGLVLARRAPVPAEQQGTNPLPTLEAIVSCMTVGNGSVQTVNVPTQPAPATSTGDTRIEANLDLPKPCIAPIVFVGSPTGAWFAATGF